ncbi:hypothetical protein OC834_006335 [Tilletia horrida]|nr:hypothetical protein OC834_006335 [Tilletia horrida]
MNAGTTFILRLQPFKMMRILAVLLWVAGHAAAASFGAQPVVDLPQGTISGFTNSTTLVEGFLGIPYVIPPVRFARANPVPKGYGDVNATKFGSACTQYKTESYSPGSEDCLFVNVFRPANTPKKAKLPVAIFIHGGSFTSGSGASYPGYTFVKAGVDAKKPFILVTLNYRLGVLGFLSGSLFEEQVRAGNATLNAGYWDQREAQLWVAKNIAAFGGDPTKVTLWGQSAGAFSVGAQLTFKSNQDASQRPFRAAIMNSGVQFPVTLPPTHPVLSQTYLNLLNYTGCPPTSSAAALACLRSVNASTLASANTRIVTNSSLTLGFLYALPVLDGDFFPLSPNKLLKMGKFADVPILVGDTNDEGTIFAPTGISGNAGFLAIASGLFASNVTASVLAAAVVNKVSKLYPDVLPLGSPYLNPPTKASQGVTNGSNPFFTKPKHNQYKRIASLLGDIVFQANRRLLLRNVRSGTPAWSYIFRQIDHKDALSKGSAHGYDIPYLFGNQGSPALDSPALYEPLSKMMQRAWASFISDLDPRTADKLDWPKYNCRTGKMLFQFKGLNNTLTKDDYREESIAYLTSPDAAAIFSS